MPRSPLLRDELGILWSPAEEDHVPADLTDIERRTIAFSLRHARGRYAVERTAQLSGVPKSTCYDWRREGILVPDYSSASPVMWSYRDLVLLRLLA